MKVTTAIPLVRRPDDLEPLAASPAALLPQEDGTATSLEAERFGLLTGPAAPVDVERKLEDWIAGNVDLGMSTEPIPRNIWDRLIDRLPALRRSPKKRRGEGGSETAFAD